MTTTDPLTREILDAGRRLRQTQDVEAIARRIEYSRLPWHKRLLRPRPKGWGTGRFGI